MNTLPFAGLLLSQKAVHLRMSDDSTTVKEQCDGPAKEGEIGNVDVSAAKFGTTEDIPTDGVIQLSENAKKQLTQLRKARGDAELVLRVGVRSGGCRSLYFASFVKFWLSLHSTQETFCISYPCNPRVSRPVLCIINYTKLIAINYT